ELLEISVSTVSQWCRSGRLPHKKLGKRHVCFLREDLVEFKKTLAKPQTEVERLQDQIDSLQLEVLDLRSWRTAQQSLVSELANELTRLQYRFAKMQPTGGNGLDCAPPQQLPIIGQQQ